MNLFKGLLGAGVGFLTGGPGGAAVGGIGGLTGTNPHEDPMMKQQRLFQQGIANQMLGYANSVPGSSPDELANFSQSRGMLGQQQRQQQSRVMGAWNPNQGTSATGLMQGLTNSGIAQQMAQHASFLQDAAANRRQALMSAASLGQGAASLYRPQQAQFPQMAGQLAQMLAYRNAQKQQQAGNADVNMINQQGPQVFGGGGIGGNGIPAPPPAGWQTSGAGGQTLDPAQLQALFAQMGWNPAASGMPGAAGAPMTHDMMFRPPDPLGLSSAWQGVGQPGPAPGNELGGWNGLQNQIRRSMGLDRMMVLPNGTRLPF